MKKLKYIATFVLLVCFALLTAACRETLLETPVNFTMHDTFTLYWRNVTEARSYEIEIRNVDSDERQTVTSRHTYLSLAFLSEGNYEVRVRAVGGMNNELFSRWSSPFEFERGKESGLLMELTNGNTEYSVTGVGTASGDVVIEDVYRGKPVTAIAEDAFRGRGSSRLRSVVIGPNVQSIGANAFYNCTMLTSVTIPDSVTYIGESAFQGCNSLQSVRLPSTITEIPDYMFAYCRGLESIEIGDNILYIGESAFFRCSKLKEIVLPDAVMYIGQHAFDESVALESVTIGSGIQVIASFAFYKCTALERVVMPETLDEELYLADEVFEGCTALTDISLPEGLVQIGAYDFYQCSSLAAVEIPATVERIGQFAFRDTALYKTQTEGESGDGLVYADDWLVAATDAFKLSVEKLTKDNMRSGTVGIADWAFIVDVVNEETGARRSSGPTKLTEIELPASVRYIGINAFFRCPVLTKLTVETGSELKAIGDYAFRNCSVLSNVRFAEGLEDIGSYVFQNCSMLSDGGTNLVPRSVTRIGTYAFDNTGLWIESESNGGVAYAGNWIVGYNNIPDTTITVADGTVGIADYAFYQNETIINVNGLGTVERIGRGAFFGCTALSSISLSASLERIEDNTFNGCTSLFDFGKNMFSLKSIGLRAFYNCTALDQIDLVNTLVTEIGEMAFYGCANVTTLNFNEGLKSIGEAAFAGLTSLTELTLPASLETLEGGAFEGCESLTKINFAEDGALTFIGDSAFMDCTALPEVTLPENLEYLGSYAFYRDEALEKVDLGGTLYIGRYAFATSPMKLLVVPESVQYIGDFAFKNCKSLHSVLFEGTPLYVGRHAFYGSPTLTFYTKDGSDVAAEWNARWNSSFRPVLWKCELSEEGYLVSFTVEFENVSNPFARGGVYDPMRAGYHFGGWALTPDGEAVYAADEWRKAEMGTTLYAVWLEGDPVEPEPEPEPEDPDEGEEEGPGIDVEFPDLDEIE